MNESTDSKCLNCDQPVTRMQDKGRMHWIHSDAARGLAHSHCDRKWLPTLRFHHAINGWCKVSGLQVREVPECEGGGYIIREDQAKRIVDALNK